MFKLAAFSDEISRDLERACQVCAEFGVTGLELRNVWDTTAQDFTAEEIRRADRIVRDHGMTVCSIGSGFGKCELDDPGAVASHMDLLRRAADVARELRCRIVRGFAFWGHGARRKPWDRILKAYEPVPAILEGKGVVLGLENEASCYVGTGAHTRAFLDLLGCLRVKAVWDPANHVHDPDYELMPPFPDGYRLVREDMAHVHVKDADIGPEGNVRNAFMGQGLCRWPEQFQAFKDDGYEGYVSLETHVKPDRFPPEMRARYGQYLSGDAREAASKVNLAWIRDAISELD